MKQFSFWVFLFSICLALPLKTQNDLSFENDSIQEEIIGLIPESLDSDIDSLLRSWHVQYFTKRKIIAMTTVKMYFSLILYMPTD